MIPKPDGGQRPLGIPTIRDRVVQMAAKLVLEPIFEADFDDSAYGYRPKRSAGDAVRKVHHLLREGYTDVVDADLSKYFDTIPHHELMQSVARRVADRQMLKLIKAWLKAPVEERDERGNRRMTGGKGSKMGTPQGGVISPLLANVYMHRFLRHWRTQGKGEQFRAHIVNYADDFVILSRGHAVEAMEWTRLTMGRLGLTLNETKTCLRHAWKESFDFLGYTFGVARSWDHGQPYLAAQPSQKSVKRVKTRIAGVLHRGNMDPYPDVVASLNRVLAGWRNYFSYGSRRKAYRGLDHYVSKRARSFLRRRHKVTTRGTRRFSDEAIFGPTVFGGFMWWYLRGPDVNPVGEPDAGNPHVRFDERGWETELWFGTRHRRQRESCRQQQLPRTCGHRAHPRLYVRHEGVDDQRMKVPPEQWLVQLGSYPGILGEQSASMKPRGQKSAQGGPAKTRAVTRVNLEQSSKVKMRKSTLQSVGEGRCVEGKKPTSAPSTFRRGTEDSACRRPSRQRGRPVLVRGRASRRHFGWRLGRESEGLIVPQKPGDSAEGRGLTSGRFVRSQGGGDWREPEDSRKAPAVSEEALCQGQAGARVSLLPALRQGVA